MVTARDPAVSGDARETTVRIPADGEQLFGDLVIPKKAQGIVLFVHGSGSSRFSPRNRLVAKYLQRANIATLLFDLLTPKEDAIDSVTGELRFDIDLLARRLQGATGWVRNDRAAAALARGYFGASTGAAAALAAESRLPGQIKAIVSRGGRPDLAGDALGKVQAPTLLIVGGNDTEVIELNRQAASRLSAPHEVAIVPGATHLFEEPGTLEEAARLATGWFVSHLT